MGLNVYCLVTEWDPAVAAYRDVGGLDFYWDAGRVHNVEFADLDDGAPPDLPYLEEWSMPGSLRNFAAAAEYYDFLRPHLPESIRVPADAVLSVVLPDSGFEDWIRPDRNELPIDAGVPCDNDLIYSLRPATARRIAEISIPWDTLHDIADRHPYPQDSPGLLSDRDAVNAFNLEWVAQHHVGAVAAAAAQGRGAIAIVSS